PRLILAHRRRCPLHPLFRQRREVHRSCYAAEVPGVDIKGRANSTSDSSSALSLLARLNSLLSRKNSLLGLQKFPVPLRREFGCKTRLRAIVDLRNVLVGGHEALNLLLGELDLLHLLCSDRAVIKQSESQKCREQQTQKTPTP